MLSDVIIPLERKNKRSYQINTLQYNIYIYFEVKSIEYTILFSIIPY